MEMTVPLQAAFLDSIAPYPALAGLAAALDTPSEVSIRINRRKAPLAAPADADGAVPWAGGDGFYLGERPAFTFDPALHQGLYYVQDASSMAAAAAVARAVELSGGDRPLRFLDACAAPGGKTIGAICALPEGSLAVANEYSPRRVPVLVENLAKWGTAPVVVTSADASSIKGLDGFFDIIAADVPCSGEGMMRKDDDARRQWSAALLRDCAALQRAIVERLWRALRPGGMLVYSTCTFNRAENEEVVAALVADHGAEPLAVPALDGAPGVAGAIDAGFPAYRFIPGRVRGEGLFLCLLRKPGDEPAATVKSGKPQRGVDLGVAAGRLSGDWAGIAHSGSLYALPSAQMAAYAAVARAMPVVSPGIEVATVKGRDTIPSQPLALSTYLRPDAFPAAEVDTATALTYLCRNAVSLPDGTPRGIVLLTHGGHPLGFVKNLGSRANNLYPASWRILSQQPRAATILKIR